MKNYLYFGIAGMLSFTLLAGLIPNKEHAFYVSITELEIKRDTLQITMRLFTDDLEFALAEREGRKVFLSEPDPGNKNFIHIRDYVAASVSFSNGAKTQVIEWIGHEFEDDVCWIYGQVPIPPDQRLIFFRNSILTEVHASQQNIVHFKSGGAFQTALATSSNPEVRFTRE